jgi:serine/threonine protein phosphatase PrpC
MCCSSVSTIIGSDWAYLVLISDGISSMLSDSEVVDLARNAPHPKAAAQSILSFAEELGGEDNATVIVVPLAGWGKVAFSPHSSSHSDMVSRYEALTRHESFVTTGGIRQVRGLYN